MALLRVAALLLAGTAVVTAAGPPPGPDASESGFLRVPGTTDVNLFYWRVHVALAVAPATRVRASAC